MRERHASARQQSAAAFEREAAAVRAAQHGDLHRPRYHFLPPSNWMNDPNGLIQWRGRYHLFYQHNPRGPLWGDMHWGHAISDDLVHWRDLPIALAPTPGTYDEDGVYSGCAVDNGGVPTILYTGVRGANQRVCLARADPTDEELVSWQKWPGNPIIPEPPPGLHLMAYRDPSVWQGDDGTWYMVLGASVAGVGGAALLYRSRDLLAWEYVGPLHVGDMMRKVPIWTGSMWECPQLFPLGDKHVLLLSVWHEETLHSAAYMVGSFDGRRFVPKCEGILDGGVLYAPQTMQDDRGRRLLWGWLRESRSPEVMAASRWNGVMSLPWELTLRDDDTLGVRPVVELEGLRRDHVHHADVTLDPTTDWQLPMLHGMCLDVAAEFDRGTAAAFGLIVRRSSHDEEQTRITYEPMRGRLAVDRRRSSLDRGADSATHAATLTLAEDEPLRLRVFLDCSVIEIIANERVALTTRIYPTRADSLGVAPFSAGGVARLRSLDLWTMDSITSQTRDTPTGPTSIDWTGQT